LREIHGCDHADWPADNHQIYFPESYLKSAAYLGKVQRTSWVFRKTGAQTRCAAYFLEKNDFWFSFARKREVVFNDDEHTILFRMNIQSLAPRLEIDTSVPGILEDKTKEIDKKVDAQYDRFHEMLSIGKRHRKNANGGRQIGKPVIIDNSKSDATYKWKYKDNVEIVMDNLRSRIAAKILLHEVNIYQKKISDYAKKMTGAGEGGSNYEKLSTFYLDS
ncbi:hypothetical protein Tco_0844367, partial [Tanacetum coccineum]